jgi:hypothetical protein
MEETTISKAANLSGAMPLDVTDILPPLEELSEEELFDINGGTARAIIEILTVTGAVPTVNKPAPNHLRATSNK